MPAIHVNDPPRRGYADVWLIGYSCGFTTPQVVSAGAARNAGASAPRGVAPCAGICRFATTRSRLSGSVSVSSTSTAKPESRRAFVSPSCHCRDLCAGCKFETSSVPPAERGRRWSATHGSFARGPSPHNAHTIAAALTLAESRPYVPVRFGGFGCFSHRHVGNGRPQIV